MLFQCLKNGVLSCGILLTLLFITVGCDIEEPEFTNLRDFRIVKVEGQHFEVEFTVDCDNPNKFGFKVKPSKLNLFVEEEDFGTVTLDDKVKIRRKSLNSYTVPVSIDLKDGSFFRLMKYAVRSEVNVTLEGKVRGSVYGIPKSMNIRETRVVAGNKLNLNFGK